MNDKPNSKPVPEAEQNQPVNEVPPVAEPQARVEPPPSVLDTLRSAMHEGAQQAKAAAQEAAPKIKSALTDATHAAGFGVSFAAVFCYVVAKELTPDVFKRGCREGAAAGKEAAERLASRLRQPSQAQSVPPATSGPEEVNPAAQPSPA